MTSRISQRFEKSINIADNILRYIGVGMLFVLMALGAGDVMGRYVFNRPILGTMEISEALLAGVLFFGWAYTQATRGHVRVNLLLPRFSPRARSITDIVNLSLGLVLFGLIGWQAAKIAIVYWKANRLIDVIMVPLAPFQMFVSVGALFLCLEFIVQMLQSVTEMRKGG